jgi:single-stranded DNA-binding protein
LVLTKNKKNAAPGNKPNNNCFFIGYLVDEAKIINVENVIKATFLLKVVDGLDFVLVPCELWGSAADYFSKKFVKNDKIWVQATFKTDKWQKNGNLRTKNIYRVNSFGLSNE